MLVRVNILLALIPFLSTAETTVYGGFAGDPLPTGTIQFFPGACPSDYTEHTALQGRYVVGLPSGGTMSGTVGVALTNIENRLGGNHRHFFDAVGGSHNHSFTGSQTHNHDSIQPLQSRTAVADSDVPAYQSTLTQTSLSSDGANVTVNTANLPSSTSSRGYGGGTNAPYIQLRACRKN